MSSFRGIYTARSGLDAARRALDVVGHNVANANTAGYSRREVSFASAEPAHVINAVGRGVSESTVLRYRDQFLDKQYRTRAGAQGYYSTLSTQLAQVEQVVGDLSEGGMRLALDQFFNAWDTLAQRPNDPAAQSRVVTAAEDFVNYARSTFSELSTMRANVDEAISEKVQEINLASRQVADLNKAIMGAQVNGQPANDLLDQRDQLLDALAKLGGTTSVEHADGTVSVYLGSLPVVDKAVYWGISASTAVEADADADPNLVSAQQNVTVLKFDGTNNPAVFQSGEVAGLMQVRDRAVPEVMKYLDTLVRTVAAEVNTIHMRDDATGAPLDAPVAIFTDAAGNAITNTPGPGTKWLDIEVNAAVRSNPSLVLAGEPGRDPVTSAQTPPAASDGRRALDLARLRNQTILTGAPVGSRQVTPGDYLRAISTTLGMDVQQAQRLSQGAEMQVAQATRHRESVSGVSLDEEMSKMIQFQQTYNASARMMTTMDEMLDTIINRVGLVGR